jgi:hypothetical protein
MAQDSIAYGESLLANIRDRNDKLRSQAKKEAKKDQWKSLAVSIGMNVVDNVFTGRQEALLNNEKLMAKKLEMTQVDTEANAFHAEIQKAMEYEGGIEAYKRNEHKKMVDARLKLDYVPGTYSIADYNLLVQKVSDASYDEFSESFDKRKASNKTYLASGNTAAYQRAINAEAKTKGMSGTILNAIGLGKITGNAQTDLLNVNPYEKNAAAQKVFQDQYKKTKDAGLSEFIAKEFSKEKRMKLGNAEVVFGDEWITYKTVNSAGLEEERKYKEWSQTQRDGSVETGVVSFDNILHKTSSENQIQNILEFSTAAAINLQNNNIQAGQSALLNLKPEDSNVIDKHVRDSLSQKNIEAGDGAVYDNASKEAKGTIASYVNQGGIAAADSRTGWGTAKDGRKVQLGLILENLRSSNPKDMPISGIQNPFETMFMIDKMSSDLVSGTQGISVIASNGVALYNRYHSEDIASREKTEEVFKNMSFFKNPKMADSPSRKRAEKTMEVVKLASELGLNPRSFGGTKNMLLAVDSDINKYRDILYGTDKVEDSSNLGGATGSTKGESGRENPILNAAVLEGIKAPEGPSKTRSGQQIRWSSVQHKEYAKLVEVSENIKEIETKLNGIQKGDFGARRKISGLKKRLAEEKAGLIVSKNEYTEKYL